MIEKIKKLLAQLKTWFTTKLLPWITTKMLPWLKKNWMVVVNYLVIFIAYSIVYGHDGVVVAETLLGLWLFVSVAYAAYKFLVPKK